MDAALSSALLSAQKVLVMRRVREGSVEIVPPSPVWLTRLPSPPPPADQAFAPDDFFPFLQACLPEAEAFWSGSSRVPVLSVPWTEWALDGSELPLEATALRLEEGCFLLVRPAEKEHSTRQRLLQLARVSALEHEQLLAEISAKDILLHCIIHDLAGPLAGIQGCLEILAQARLGSKEAEFVQMGLRQAGRQGRLIQDLLDVFASQIASIDQSGASPPAPPDLIDCVHEVTHGLSAAFQVRKVELRTMTPSAPATAVPVVAERARLERILYNLLENALRFSPPGSVVTLQLYDDGPWIRATVADQGPGVAPEILPRLFQRFVSGGGLPGKSGLGLFFCRIAVERWGGSIACDSGSATGARFTIRLKKAAPEPAEAA